MKMCKNITVQAEFGPEQNKSKLLSYPPPTFYMERPACVWLRHEKCDVVTGQTTDGILPEGSPRTNVRDFR